MSGYINTKSYKGTKWNAICDVCGFEFKSDELKSRWDGLMVCKEDFEIRHPQDLMKAPPPERPIPWSRPEGADVFIDVPYVASTVGTQDTTVPTGTFTQGT